MREPEHILVPCEVFEVRAIVGPNDCPSLAEELVLGAVGAGANTFEELASLFGLGYRPTLDMVYDLWHLGHVSVDLARGRITLIGDAERAVAAGQVKELVGGERQEMAFSLMFDLVAGNVLRIYPAPSKFRTGRVVPTVLERGSYRKCQINDLLSVVRNLAASMDTHGGRNLRVLEVHHTLPGTKHHDREVGSMRHLELHVTSLLDAGGEDLQFRIEHPSSLGFRTRSGLERALARLADERPGDQVFQALRREAERADTEHFGNPLEPLFSLRDATDRIDAIDLGNVESWQRRLEELSDAALDTLNVYGGVGLKVEIIGETDAQIQAVTSAIDEAEKQVVISCPFLSYDAFQSYRRPIEQALSRGVRFFLLWGMERERELDPGLRSWFEKLDRELFWYSDLPSNCHGKFVISDLTTLFLTSYNFLNRLSAGPFELGVRVRSSDEGVPSGPAAYLLGKSELMFPDYYAAQLIRQRPEEFGISASRLDESAATNPILPRLSDSNKGNERIARIWAQEWKEFVTRLFEQEVEVEKVCRIVIDREHRELLRGALATTNRRLLVMSDRLTGDVVNRRFLAELEKVIGRGAQIVLIAQRPDAAPLAALKRMSSEHPDQLKVVLPRVGERVNKSHAKVLVTDEFAVVSSFNFLSFEGYYAGAQRHRVRSEVGFLLWGEDWTHEVLSAVGITFEEASVLIALGTQPSSKAKRAENKRTARGDNGSRRSLLRLMEDLSECDSIEDTGETLLRWFSSAVDDAGAVGELEVLARAGAVDRRAVAACLLSRTFQGMESVRQKWFGWLVEESWHEKGNPFETLLLTSSNSFLPRASVPSAEILRLASQAAIGKFSVSEFEREVLSSGRGASEIRCLASIGIRAGLLDGVAVGESLEVILEELDSPLRDWLLAAKDFWSYGPRAIPIDSLVSWISEESAQKEIVLREGRLERELERAIGMSFTFKLGQVAWPRLVEGPGGYRSALSSVRKGKQDEVVTWLERHGETPRTIDERFDRIVGAAAESANLLAREVVGKKRRLCVNRMTRVASRARKWLDLTAAVQTPKETEELEDAKRLIKHLSKQLPDLLREADRASRERRAEAPLLFGLIDSFKRVVKKDGAR